MKIGNKLGGTFLLFTLVLTVLFYTSSLENQRNTLKEIVGEQLGSIKNSFEYLQQRDTKMLMSTLEAIVRDPAIKALCLEKNRDKLYDYAAPLFRQLQGRYGITDFDFILPDGRVFLRMQKKGLYGDRVEMTSFEKARDTDNPVCEMEMGKTAFALRAVMPCRDGGRLIGYVGLAEGINHFLAILKDETNSEYTIVARKECLDRQDWMSAKKAAGLRDDWDDFKNHVILASTDGQKIPAGFLSEGNMAKIEKNKECLLPFRIKDRTYMGCGFAFGDMAGHTGAVLALMDITNHIAIIRDANRAMLHASAIIFVLMFAAGAALARFITKPVSDLTEVAKAVEAGNLEKRVAVNSGDEIGRLGATFNSMIEQRKEYESALRTSLKEKETLLRELYHRTKNNMQVISSMISLQTASIKDENTLHIFDDMRGRIRSMSLVHEKLYKAGGLSEVDMRDYIRELANSMLVTYEGTAANITLVPELEQVFCHIDKAVACGLVIHELMSNALKHAFPNGRKGEIRIALRQTENSVNLSFSDNGAGFPKDFDIAKAGTLGMKIIYTIIEKQLKGKVELKKETGASYLITFKK